jgi:hypothetical protein
MTAAVGNVVGLYMDTRAEVEFGDVIQTQTGRTYRVVEARRQERGKHAGRWHLRVLVVVAASITPSDNVKPLRWYRR